MNANYKCMLPLIFYLFYVTLLIVENDLYSKKNDLLKRTIWMTTFKIEYTWIKDLNVSFDIFVYLKLKKFGDDHPDLGRLQRIYNQILEAVQANIKFMDTNTKVLESWLNNQWIHDSLSSFYTNILIYNTYIISHT